MANLFMKTEGILTFLILTVFSSTLGTLKHLLISRGQKRASYITIFFDSLIFSTILKKISGGDGLIFGVAYGTGKVLGAMLANKLEEVLALGTIEISISLNHFDRMVSIADELRDLGYTVETYSVYGYEGKTRYKIDVIIDRKEVQVLRKILEKNGYDEPTMTVKHISKFSGKISAKCTDSTKIKNHTKRTSILKLNQTKIKEKPYY